ncbi:arginyltransferase [Parashewanella curva]|uniref:Aspartate/glutamate leucyltransferase n=1 Tax=Parashewanella curva TaxID=2338552 RepID=A0A3L8PX86_9GAMM|nr:arginyltransferase [Parashewanella curva]RLV60077.1 arginyltransferase [Parashewanella curva]
MSEETPPKENAIYLGLTQTFPCSYLENQKEQLLTLTDTVVESALYERMLGLGFRRSGNAIYKPHCPNCSACQSIRIPAADFKPSRRQKRTSKQNQKFSWHHSTEVKTNYYPLYEKYINERHRDGSMYPASTEQFEQFLLCDWLPDNYIEIYDNQKLIGVAVIDLLDKSVSAIYSFFDPDYHKHSLGSYMILLTIELAKQLNRDYVYLGYQINDCRKMNYKTKYQPYQLLTDAGWLIQEELSSS